MGNCTSTEIEHDTSSIGMGAAEEEARISRAIDRQIKQDEKALARQVKLLLLGAGESGKTTVLKQMKIIHLNGFQPHEIDHYRFQIFDNLCDAMRQCLIAMEDWEMSLLPENLVYVQAFEDQNAELTDDQPYPIEYLTILKTLWADPGIQRVVKRSNEASIPENMTYFFPQLDRLFEANYRPTLQDILRARGKTSGITETVFFSRELTYRLFDVGGQRSERKKWIHCFEGVTAVIFLAAISGYDQCLVEDPDSNVMQEALMLFDSICNSKWFTRTSIILFLNKTDLFKEKILVSDIRRHFPEYKGPAADYNAAREFFKNMFISLNRSKEKEIYLHYTCAVDTKAVKVVMASVTECVVFAF